VPVRYGRTEASVLSFAREQLHEGVQLARIALRSHESSTFHKHTVTRDTFFVMAGRLTIDLRVGKAEPASAYRCLNASEIMLRNGPGGALVHRVLLDAGHVCVVEPGVVHCAMNLDPDPCHFLCIEGIGEYDFVEADS
jgi:mannose-6-phosphate isomerase-like protein (cupin superfamily)